MRTSTILRALIMARLAMLPTGGSVPAPAEVGEEERNRLLSEFLDADETVGLFGIDSDEDEAIEGLSHQILTFALDYVAGTPLRFSSVMVKMFCLDWAPRKIVNGWRRLHVASRRPRGMDSIRGSATQPPRTLDS